MNIISFARFYNFSVTSDAISQILSQDFLEVCTVNKVTPAQFLFAREQVI